ncbi:putative aliphatic sulfonates transport permease protein SsuC [Candidatus Entotheonellaceae bacterium PAL068K]
MEGAKVSLDSPVLDRVPAPLPWPLSYPALWNRVLSVAVLFGLWAFCSWLLSPLILPSPWFTFHTLWEDVQQGDIFYHLGATLWRIFWSFASAMLLGVALGLAMGLSKRVETWFDTWLVLALNTPALIYIFLAYLALGLNEWAAILAVAANKIPVIIVTVQEGVKAINVDLVDMARVYRTSQRRILFKVILPQVLPYIMAAARASLSLVWKIVLVVEFLGRSNGMGFQLHLFFQLFDMAHVLSYTLVFVGVMLLIEFLIVKKVEQALFRWRR